MDVAKTELSSTGLGTVPRSAEIAARNRLHSILARDGKGRDNWDSQVALVFQKYGSRKVQKIMGECRRLGMRQTVISRDQYMTALQTFVSAHTARNLHGLADYERALSIVAADLRRVVPSGGLHPVVPRTEAELYQFWPKKDANAGYLGLLTGKPLKKDNLLETLQAVAAKVADLRNMDYDPIVFASRTNIRNITVPGSEVDLNPNWDCKTRPIQVVSATDVCLEGYTAKPLIECMKRLSWYAGGDDGEKLNADINSWRMRLRNWTSIDYSQFDSTIPDWLIRDAFNLMFALFNESELPEGYKEFIVRGFCYTRLILEDRIVRKTGGVPSGSYFTQLIDSVCNQIMITYYWIKTRKDAKRNMVMGDDNIIFSEQPIDLKELSEFMSNKFGVHVKPEKCTVGHARTDPPQFLSRFWDWDGAGRDIREVVVKALQPEYWRDYRKEGMDASLIFWALCSVYPKTMKLEFNVTKFMRDHPHLLKTGSLNNFILEGLPGSVRYKLLYLDNETSLSLGRVHHMPGCCMSDRIQLTKRVDASGIAEDEETQGKAGPAA